MPDSLHSDPHRVVVCAGALAIPGFRRTRVVNHKRAPDGRLIDNPTQQCLLEFGARRNIWLRMDFLLGAGIHAASHFFAPEVASKLDDVTITTQINTSVDGQRRPMSRGVSMTEDEIPAAPKGNRAAAGSWCASSPCILRARHGDPRRLFSRLDRQQPARNLEVLMREPPFPASRLLCRDSSGFWPPPPSRLIDSEVPNNLESGVEKTMRHCDQVASCRNDLAVWPGLRARWR